jgi:hypothetical protein
MRASIDEDPIAMFNLGVLSKEAVNTDEAREWFTKTAA